jgi:lipid II isoglutaminyl synthase (glutamine-hydrolysing)
VSDSKVTIAVVYPDLLGTYGDGGNASVLGQRLRWRGFSAEVVQVTSGQSLPSSADIFCLGGGEDGPQTAAVAALESDGVLSGAPRRGSVVFAVCAGYQVIGKSFPGSDGRAREGLGLIDVITVPGVGQRAVGELASIDASGLDLGTMTGYENHAGRTHLGSGVGPLGTVQSGIGNGAVDRSEGAIAGRVVGTYMHGPALARNPVLADLLLSWIVGPLPALDDSDVAGLRAERLVAASRASTRSGFGLKSVVGRGRR